MNVNRLLAALQRIQLHNSGTKDVRIVMDKREYSVKSIGDFTDNVIIEVKECKTAGNSNS